MEELRRIASARHTLILVAIFAAVAVSGFLSAGPPVGGPRIATYLLVAAALWALLRYVALGVRRHGGSLVELVGLDAGLRAWLVDVALAIVGSLALRAVLVAVKLGVGPYDDHATDLLPRTWLEKLVWLLLAASAGICEELTFRGYFQTQLGALLRSRAAGLLLQALLFGVAHGYQGWRSTVVISAYGLFVGLLTQVRGNVRAAILIHFATDALAGIFGL